MNKLSRQVLALLTVVCLCAGMLPMSAVANEPEEAQAYDFSFTGTLVEGDTPQVCYYSDSYFLKDARDYDSHLATMSLCFELTTFSRSDESGAEWTAEVNEDSNARVQNAYDLLTQLGFENFTANEFWAEAPGKDSIGAIAADKTLSDGSRLIALGVRGGGYGQEWASNFTVNKEGEHQGFAEATEHVLTFLKQYISNNRITGPIKLWIVGYSRAGCVANMVAGNLNNGYSLGRVFLAQKDLFAYCFAPPQGTLKEYAETGDHSNIHNIINLNDIVPLVAPSSWGFARYNTDRWLPSAATTDQFDTLKANMLTYLAGFENADSDGDGAPDYSILEYGTQYELVANWENLLISGEPVLSLEPYQVPTSTILAEAGSFLFDDAIGGRETYYYDFQAGVRELFALVSGGSVEDLLDDGMSPSEFLRRFFAEFTAQRIIEIVSPMTDPTILSIAARYQQVEENLERTVKDILNDSDLWGTVIFVADLGETLTQTLWRILESVLEDLLIQDTSSLQALINVVTLVSDGSLLQAHLPEIMLSWLMSQDSCYGEGQVNVSASMTRIIRINGPVDMTVYRTGTTEPVAAFLDDVPQELGGSIYAYVNSSGEKILLLPPDGDYTISLTATGQGTLSYTVDEYRLDTQTNARILYFGGTPVSAGDAFTAAVPSFSKAELVSQLPNGSNAEYTLTDSTGQRIGEALEYTGTKAEEAVYTVSVFASNANGSVLGGGTYSLGSFARVEARAASGFRFLGWYQDGRLVSTESVYRFPVTRDTHLFARYSDEETSYEVTFSAGEGGTIVNEPVSLHAGSSLQIIAVADEGYAFDHWQAKAGTFEDSTSASTWFTVPDCDVTVEAVFRSIDPEHIHTETAIPGLSPTCTDQGLTEGSWCQTCGQILTEQEILPALGHDYSGGVCLRCGEEAPVNPFTDVTESDYFYDSVLWAAENSLTAGTSAATFSPELSCTREQVVTFLWRAAGSPQPESTESPFVDVRRSDYCYQAVLWAVEKGITSGISDSRFGPELSCTRAQVAVFLWRAAGSPEPETADSPFSDVSEGDYFRTAVLWAAENDIAAGITSTHFGPGSTCTRGQIVTFLYRTFA